MPGFRAITALAAVGLVLAAGVIAASAKDPVPLPPDPPAAKSKAAATAPKKPVADAHKTHDKAHQTHDEAQKTHDKGHDDARKSHETLEAHKTPSAPTHNAPARSVPVHGAPLSLTPSVVATPNLNAVPPSGVLAQPPPAPPASARPPFAAATTSTTSPLDIAAVKQAIELIRKNRQDEATGVEAGISDPLARKLVEWIVLRSEDGSHDFSRYAAFIAANPSWPSIETLRRRAEAVAFQEQVDPRAIIDFFRAEKPHTAKGHFALARALLARGDVASAAATMHDCWRKDGFSEDMETQARALFAGLITPADDEARMQARFYVEDTAGGLRAARHLDATAQAIARARAAVIDQSANAKALLEAVPEAARRDPGYMFSRVQWLRRNDKIAEAAQWLNAAPREAASLIDVDQWWIERRLVARKLLDLGDARMAYGVVEGAAPPLNDNYRSEQHFTAGWIALRFLREPGAAIAQFARVADGATNPITLARSYYWQGRSAEALGHGQEARTLYQEAAHYPTAYYGQLARARLGLDEVTLRAAPEPTSEHRLLELARAFDILYAADERDIVAIMAADLGEKATDGTALAMLASIATRHNDARATLLIGKAALGRGYPFERYAFPEFGVPDYQQIGPAVERCVVYAIVRQESAFNPKVVSSANAIGLMQVTPESGRDTAKRFNVIFNQRRLAEDVVYNAQIGTAELGNDIASWRGSYILAFVAYNAGPRRAREWIEQFGDPRDPKVDPVDWIERIPISETRNYVERVLENMQVYRAVLENNPRLSIETDLRRGG